jgi:hypothetical protein
MVKKSGLNRPSRPGSRPGPRSRPFWLQRLRRRELIWLLGLTMLACTSLITVGLLILRYQSGPLSPAESSAVKAIRPTPVHTVSYTEVTGLSRYQAAQQQGLAWAGDAQLVSASANWPNVTALDQVGQPVEWSYRFYSPAKERLFIVKIALDNQVTTIEPPVKITVPPGSFSADRWLVDSPTALALWLDYGGAELLRRNPGLEVLIQLRHLKNYDSPVWMVAGLDKRTQDIHIVVVDAAEGFILQSNEQKF